MRLLAPLVAVVLVSVAASADTGFLDRSVSIGGNTYRYQTYVPEEYNPATPSPVILVLHGDGPQGSDGLRHTAAGLADVIRRNRSLFPTIVVFPQAQAGTQWHNAPMQDLAIAALDKTAAEFRVDPDRVYLVGSSMGGTGAYRVAYRWPQRFAGVVVFAGTVARQGAEITNPRLTEIDRQANPFVGAANPSGALAARIKHLPVWIFHGDADELVSVEQSRRVVPALKEAGAAVRYTEYPGLNHGAGIDKGMRDPEMIKWLLAQRRTR